MSSRVSAPPWNIDLTPFYLGSPYQQPASKFWRTWFSPLKCTIVQKCKDSFFKETQAFISNDEVRTQVNFEIWNMNMQLQNLKIKEELGFF